MIIKLISSWLLNFNSNRTGNSVIGSVAAALAKCCQKAKSDNCKISDHEAPFDSLLLSTVAESKRVPGNTSVSIIDLSNSCCACINDCTCTSNSAGTSGFLEELFFGLRLRRRSSLGLLRNA
jgi:hypothetical protein